jgi:DNA-binding transcriptional regulator GbsR (MarR family)
MEVTLESSLIKQKRSDINRILGTSEVVDHIEASSDIREKIANQTVQLSDIKKLERQLVEFCEMELFRHWKKTESR